MKTLIQWPREIKNWIKQGQKYGYDGWLMVGDTDEDGIATFEKKGDTDLYQFKISLFLKKFDPIEFEKEWNRQTKPLPRGGKKVNLVGARITGLGEEFVPPDGLEPLFKVYHSAKNSPNHYVGHIAIDLSQGHLHIVREDGKETTMGVTMYSPGVDVDNLVKNPDFESLIHFEINTKLGLGGIEYRVKCTKCSIIVRIVVKHHNYKALGSGILEFVGREELKPLAGL